MDRNFEQDYQRQTELLELMMMPKRPKTFGHGVFYERAKLHSMVYLTDEMLKESGTSIGEGYEFDGLLFFPSSSMLKDDICSLSSFHMGRGSVSAAHQTSKSFECYAANGKAMIDSDFFGDRNKYRRKLESAEKGLFKRTKRRWNGLANAHTRDVVGMACEMYADRNRIDLSGLTQELEEAMAAV